MKSPTTGKEMILQDEPCIIEVQGEKRRIMCKNYLCVDTGETYATGDLDETNHYRLNNDYEKL
jgi:hypothetical protein